MLDLIRIKGTPFEAGYALGHRTAELIRTVLGEAIPVILRHPFYGGDLPLLRNATEQHRLATEKISPGALEFVQGMARGAGVEYEDLLIHIFVEELNPEVTADRCSSLVAWSDKEDWIHGHQEDYKPRYVGRMFVCVAEIEGCPAVVSLNFPASLLHLAGSLNEAGFSLSNNAFWQPVRPGLPKQPRHYAAALAERGEDAVSILSMGSSALTDHFLGVDGRARVAHSLEISHPDHVTTGSSRWRQAGPPAEGEPRVPFYCANSVRYLHLHWPDPAPPASKLREARLAVIAEEAPPRSFGEMLGLLSTRDGVLRHDRHRDLTCHPDSITLATVVMAPAQKRFVALRYPDQGPAKRDEFRF